jgi:hypothetical protein
MYLTCKIFLSATCTLDEPDKHFSHKLLLYFAFFVKWVKILTYLSIWLTRPLTIHNTVHWSVRHTQSFRCLLIYPIKWDNWLLRCLFLTIKGKQLFFLAEAALRWNFIFWSYFVVIFRVEVDLLYRRVISTSCILRKIPKYSRMVGCYKDYN